MAIPTLFIPQQSDITQSILARSYTFYYNPQQSCKLWHTLFTHSSLVSYGTPYSHTSVLSATAHPLHTQQSSQLQHTLFTHSSLVSYSTPYSTQLFRQVSHTVPLNSVQVSHTQAANLQSINKPVSRTSGKNCSRHLISTPPLCPHPAKIHLGLLSKQQDRLHTQHFKKSSLTELTH